mgnify:CR=1 FL=1
MACAARLAHHGRVSGFRQSAQRIMSLQEAPETLWVVHSPATRLMCEDADGPHLGLEDHFDWLLALGRSELGLIRLEARA